MTTEASIVARASWRKHWLSGSNSERLINVLSPIVLLVLWEFAARVSFIDTRFFPPPTKIGEKLIYLLGTGELERHTYVSLVRLFWGLFLGGIPAVLLGIIMGLNRVVRAIVDPLLAATYPVPKSSVLPLVLLVFGLGESSKIFMVALGVFFPVVFNTTTGVIEINKIYFDVGKNFKAGRWNTFRTIALPGALPVIIAGVKLGIGMGLVLLSVAEMMGAKSGLGFLIWDAWETFSVEQMYVGLFVIALIGFVLTTISNELERLLIPWKGS
jgi:NitT/TauT family transport system permease protein